MILKLNQKEYGEKMGVDQAAISYRINNGLHLPGIVKTERFSRFYVLHYESRTNIVAAKKYFQKKAK